MVGTVMVGLGEAKSDAAFSFAVFLACCFSPFLSMCLSLCLSSCSSMRFSLNLLVLTGDDTKFSHLVVRLWPQGSGK